MCCVQGLTHALCVGAYIGILRVPAMGWHERHWGCMLVGWLVGLSAGKLSCGIHEGSSRWSPWARSTPSYWELYTSCYELLPFLTATRGLSQAHYFSVWGEAGQRWALWAPFHKAEEAKCSFCSYFSQWKNLWAMEASLGPDHSPLSWTLELPYRYSLLWMVAKSVFLLGDEGWNLLFRHLADAIPVKVLFRSVSELFK